MTKLFCDYCGKETTGEDAVCGKERGFCIDGNVAYGENAVRRGRLTVLVSVNDPGSPAGAQPDVCLSCVNQLLSQGVQG